MKLSYRWLGNLVDLHDTTSEQIARLLTFHVAEIEDVETLGDALAGVVTARVTAVRPHPDADRLAVCTVDVGDGAPVEVVCGAPKVAEGQVVAFAPAGVTLPGGLTLERREVRGVVSNGMICAEDELGLGDDHEGILVLPDDTAVGEPFAAALELSDAIFEIDNIAITHRPDLWGHVGFARELSAILSRQQSLPTVPDATALMEGADPEPYPITIEDEQGCRRYVGIVLEGLENGPSPLWLRRRLASLGVRSIDRIVDLTNLILLEQGQPLHAFDLRDIQGGEIRVRRARDGERMTTLDEIERVLTPDDVVIADAERPVAIAGVMGGAGSGVRPDTTAILLESATFDPVRVRRTSQRLGLRTDASSRFEKSLDAERAMTGALRFVAVAQEMMPSVRVRQVITDVHPRPDAPVEIRLPTSLVRRRLGIRIPDATIRSRLGALGFRVKEDGAVLHVGVPSWRASKDVRCPEDLVEEVGRIGGYGTLPSIAPLAPMVVRAPSPRRMLRRTAAAALSLDLGYSEVTQYSFCGTKELETLGLADVSHLRIANARSDVHDRLIQTSAANLLQTASRNQVGSPSGALWESTRLIVPAEGGLPTEIPVFGGVAWDARLDDDVDGRLFLQVVSDLRRLLARMDLQEVSVRQAETPGLRDGLPAARWLHPGRTAVVASRGVDVGVVGEVTPAVRRGFDLGVRAVTFEIDVEAVLVARERSRPTYEPPLRYPVVPFDVSVIVPRKTAADDVIATMTRSLPDHIRDVHCFDVYEGEGIPAGQRSLAFRCELFDRTRTLATKEADRMRGTVIDALATRGWTVRTA